MLQAESGADVVAAALGEGAAISVLNVAEVLSKLAAEGADPEVALTRIEQVDRALEVHQIERDDLIEIARLRPLTRGLGLSLADRACLALASRLQVPALTSDRAWADVKGASAQVVLIRE